MHSRRQVALLTAAAAGSAILGLTAEAKPAVPITPQTELTQAVEAFRKAMVSANGRKLVAMSSPSLRFGHSNGLVQSRSEFVRSIVTGKEIFRSIKLSQHRNTVVGSTGVARHIFAADILLDGKPLNVKLNCIEVWQRSGGQWRLLARQAFKT
jgi:hypothetical protein